MLEDKIVMPALNLQKDWHVILMGSRVSPYAEFIAGFEAINLVVKRREIGIVIIETTDKISMICTVRHKRIEFKKVQKIALNSLSSSCRQDVLELEAGEI